MRFAFSSTIISRRIASASLVGLFVVLSLAARPYEEKRGESASVSSSKSNPGRSSVPNEASIRTHAVTTSPPTLKPVRWTMTACSQFFEVIGPCSSSKSLLVGGQLSATFSFTNNTPENVGLTPRMTSLAFLTQCRFTPASLSVSAHQTQTFTLTCNSTTAGSGTTTVSADEVSATVAVTVTSPPALSVTPLSLSITVPPNALNRQVFMMHNLTNGNDTVDVVTPCTTYSCTLQTPSPIVVPAFDSLPDTVQFTSGAIGSSGVINAQGTVRHRSGTAVGSVFASVPYPQAPLVDVTPQNGDNRAVGLCVASCFDVMASYSTPAYTSRDTPRSATLVYSSAQAHAMGMVSINALDLSARHSQKFSLQLRQANGSNVTFTSGATELFFRQDSGAVTRLAGQFDATSLGTSVQTDTVILKSIWTAGPDAGTELQGSVAVPVLILNEQSSVFGAGWSLAGLQRIYFPSDTTTLLVTDGGGSITRFTRTCQACVATAVAADFSTLVQTQLVITHVPTGYKRTYRDGSTATYNLAGYITSTTNRFGDATTFAYNGSNQIQSITDPAGKTLTFAYLSGKLSTITDPNGRVSTFSVNASGNLVSIKDPTNTLTFQGSYDSQHRLTQWTDRGGYTWKYVYDFAGKLASDSTPSVTMDTTIGGTGSLVTSRLGKKFASLESAELIDPASGKGTSANPGSQVLDARVRAVLYGMPLETSTAHATRYALDRFLAPLQIEMDSVADTTFITRDLNEHVTKSVERRKGKTIASGTSTFSGPRVTQVTNELTGSVINYTYDMTYDLVKRISGSTQTVQNYLNAAKSLIDSTRVSSNADTTKDSVSVWIYDTKGRVITSIDPKKDTVLTYYGASRFQNTDSTRANTRLTQFRYDGFGRLVVTVNPQGDSTIVTLDGLNRKAAVSAPGARTIYGYDSLSRIVQLTDPKGQVYTSRYGPLGWVNATIDAATGDPAANRKDSLEYTKTGAVRKHINRRLQTTVTKFDHLGRDSTITLNDGRVTRFAYDPAGLWMAVENAESIDTVRTDTANLVQTQMSRHGSSRYVVTATADANGLLRSRIFTMGTSPTSLQTISYGYDAEWRLDTLSVGTQRTYFGYNTDGSLMFTKLTQHSGAMLDSMTFGVTALHTRFSVHHSLGSLSSLNTNYTRDSLERITLRTNAGGDTTFNYLYDALGELTSYQTLKYGTAVTCVPDYRGDGEHCTHTGSSTTVQSSAFSYDSVGNRTDGSPTIFAGNRLMSWNGYSLGYDYDGNLIKKKSATVNQLLYWNSVGQLDSMRTNSTLVTFGYDGLGRRVRKTVGTVTYNYVYDGDQILTIDSLGTLVRTYSYYPGVDKPHSVIDNAGHRYYYLSESGVGSVIALIDTVGGIKNRYQYAPFGSSEVASESVGNPFRFAGREYDPETQLYYYRARYYDPALARFISEDPTGLSTDINQYRYAADNPINTNDPSGTMNYSDYQDMTGSRIGEIHGPVSFGYSIDGGMGWDDWDAIAAMMAAAIPDDYVSKSSADSTGAPKKECSLSGGYGGVIALPDGNGAEAKALSVSAGAGLTSSGTFFFQVSYATETGIGAFGGAGWFGGVGRDDPITEGTTHGSQYDFNLAGEGGVGISISMDEDGHIVGGTKGLKFRPEVGLGGEVSAGPSTTITPLVVHLPATIAKLLSYLCW